MLRDCVRLGLAALRWAILYRWSVSSGGRGRAVASGWRMVLSPAWALLAGTRAMEVCGEPETVTAVVMGWDGLVLCWCVREGRTTKKGWSRVEGKGVPVVARWVFMSPSRWNCTWDRPAKGAAGGPVRSGPGQVGLVALGLALEIQWAWLLPPPVARRRSVVDFRRTRCVQNCSFSFFVSASRSGAPIRAPESSKPGWNLLPSYLSITL